MNKAIIKIKKLLKIDLFQPYNCSAEQQSQRVDTKIVIMLNDCNPNRIKELAEKCGKLNIVSCYFKGQNSILFLTYNFHNSWILGFILASDLIGHPYNNQHSGRPSDQEVKDFIHFLGGKERE